MKAAIGRVSESTPLVTHGKGMAWLALFVLLAADFALGQSLPWSLLPYDAGHWLWVTISLGFTVVLLGQTDLLPLGARWAGTMEGVTRFFGTRWGLKLLVLGNAVFALANYYQFRRVGYAFPWLHLGVVAVALAVVRRDRLWVSGLVSCALLVASMVHFPDTANRSDMFLALRTGWDQLALGHDPYGYGYNPPPHALALPYLPGTFFAHAPAWVLGFDLRWNEILWRIVWMAILFQGIAKQSPDSPWRTIAHVFVLNPYFNYRHDLYYGVFFAEIAAYQAWPRLRWITLPLLVWTRQWAWVMAPFLAWDWVAIQGRQPSSSVPAKAIDWGVAARQAGLLMFGTAAVSLLVILTLAPTSSVGSVMRAVFVYQDLVKFDYGLSLGPIFSKLHAVNLLLPLQAICAIGFWLLSVWRWWRGGMKTLPAETERIERLGLVTLCAFLLLNRLYEVYLWLDPSFWMLAVYGMRREGIRATSGARSGSAVQPAQWDSART
jgi:hypothetical protein